MGYMRVYACPRNISEGRHLMGLDPSHEVGVSKKRMLGTTIHGIVPAHSTRLVFVSPAGQQAHRVPGVQNVEHPRIYPTPGPSFVPAVVDLVICLRAHRSRRMSE